MEFYSLPKNFILCNVTKAEDDNLEVFMFQNVKRKKLIF